MLVVSLTIQAQDLDLRLLKDTAPVRIRLVKAQSQSVIKKSFKQWQVHYREKLKIYPYQNQIDQSEKKYDLVLTIGMRDYLAGVLSGEMPLAWPLEALKAQAVVARSYTLAKIQENRHQYYDVEVDQMDQVFKLPQSDKAFKAIDQTRNYILSYAARYGQSQIVKAYYHSDCGGHTIPADSVWAGALDTGTAVDPMCANRSNTWSVSIDKNNFLDGNKSVQIKKIKNKIIEIAGVSIQKIRQKFGFSIVKNSPTQITLAENKMIIVGQGFGHGAGLCQWGSRDWALRGYSFKAIVKHYYPKVELAQIDDIIDRNSLTQAQLNQTIKARHDQISELALQN